MKQLAWKAVSGYIKGLSHIDFDEPCQDRAITSQQDDVNLIVLCDGAGSCRYSEQGAITVTNAIAAMTNEQFDLLYEAENTASLLEQYLLQQLALEVDKIEGSQLVDFSCTLLFVAVKDNRYLAGHVGDGVICQRTNQMLSVLSHPENGRYANETYFVTMTPLKEHFRIYKGDIHKPIDFLLMSDGAATSFYLEQEREMESENTRMLLDHLVENTVEDVEQELDGLLQMVRSNTKDDCALALMVSHSPEDINALFNLEDEDRDDPDVSFDEDEESPEQSLVLQPSTSRHMRLLRMRILSRSRFRKKRIKKVTHRQLRAKRRVRLANNPQLRRAKFKK